MNDAILAMIPPLLVWAGIWFYLLRTNKKLAETEELLREAQGANKG